MNETTSQAASGPTGGTLPTTARCCDWRRGGWLLGFVSSCRNGMTDCILLEKRADVRPDLACSAYRSQLCWVVDDDEDPVGLRQGCIVNLVRLLIIQ